MVDKPRGIRARNRAVRKRRRTHQGGHTSRAVIELRAGTRQPSQLSLELLSIPGVEVESDQELLLPIGMTIKMIMMEWVAFVSSWEQCSKIVGCRERRGTLGPAAVPAVVSKTAAAQAYRVSTVSDSEAEYIGQSLPWVGVQWE